MFNFKCPKCDTLITYNMSMGNSAKMRDSQVCKCPNKKCNNIIVYNDIDLSPPKKGKPEKCLFTYLNAQSAKKTQK